MKCTKLSSRYFILFIASITFSNIAFGQSDTISAIRTEIYKLIKHEVQINFETTPGILIGIVDNAKQYVVGLGTYETLELTQSDSIFQLGGLSKIFTHYTLFAALYSEYLSDSIFDNNRHNPNNYHLRHLLQHRTGIPLHLFDAEQRAYSQEDIIAMDSTYFLEATKHWKASDSFYLYSDNNYHWIDYVLQRSGYDLMEMGTRFLFSPLQMKSSGFGNYIPITSGFNKAGEPVAPYIFSQFTASNGAYSSMNDLIRFVRELLSNPAHFNRSLGTCLPIQKNKKAWVCNTWHALGKNTDIILHSGHANGHASAVLMVPKTKTAVILMANSTYPINGLGRGILRMINDNWKRLKQETE